MSVRLVAYKSFHLKSGLQKECKNTDFSQLSNRLGSARCGADLMLPSAVARTGEQAITIEGRNAAAVQSVGTQL